MLMYGALGMGLSQMLVAIASTVFLHYDGNKLTLWQQIGLALPDSNSAKGPVTIVFIIVFIAHFGLTWVRSPTAPVALRRAAASRRERLLS